jgi:glutamate-5-semialdehyde dehydrogenase
MDYSSSSLRGGRAKHQDWPREGLVEYILWVDAEGLVLEICRRARVASRVLGLLPRAKKDHALLAIVHELSASRHEILSANRLDVEAAERAGLSAAMVDRLRLDERRVSALADAVREIAAMDDPVGTVVERRERPNGLRITRVRAPLGVVAMIYEARPGVAIEASALCLKAGSAVVLRGGKEAVRSNTALGGVLGRALTACGLPVEAATVLPFTDREAVKALIVSPDVDLAIPRGGEPLIRFVTENARVPVVQHYKGVCHLFLDAGSDAKTGQELVMNAKLSRPAVCNALECLLVDQADAVRLLPPIAKRLLEGGCELRGDARACELVPGMKRASEDDYGQEFSAPVLAVKTVEGLDGAIAHIARYGSGHTEAISTTNKEHAQRFLREVDAACVLVNASTRFHDGGELGLGAELGIATSRLHWRGPMGLESLTTMKWLVEGSGQVRG